MRSRALLDPHPEDSRRIGDPYALVLHHVSNHLGGACPYLSACTLKLQALGMEAMYVERVEEAFEILWARESERALGDERSQYHVQAACLALATHRHKHPGTLAPRQSG